jgi:hypothetical protein
MGLEVELEKWMPVDIIAGLVKGILGVGEGFGSGGAEGLRVGVTYYTDLTYCHR